jgi:hypothetical protein
MLKKQAESAIQSTARPGSKPAAPSFLDDLFQESLDAFRVRKIEAV